MNESIQSTSAANGISKSVLQSRGSADVNLALTDEPSEFNSVFAEFLQTEPSQTEQNIDEGVADILTTLLSQQMLEDGKLLPEGDTAAVAQAYLQIQPAENVLSGKEGGMFQFQGGAVLRAQGLSVPEGQHKPVLESPILNQNFLQSSDLNIEAQINALSAGGAARNIAAQIAALQIDPAAKDTLLFNVTEGTTPIHATHSTLSNSLSALGFGTATQTAATQLAPLSLGHQAWESNLGSRLQMLVGQNAQQAEIRLDPPDLGSLDVKIKITNDIANVSFSSPHAHVRDALESAVPRLREMFADSGLSLGDVNVRQESFAQQQNQSGEEGNASGQFMTFNQGDENSEVTRKIVSNNLLDTYA